MFLYTDMNDIQSSICKIMVHNAGYF